MLTQLKLSLSLSLKLNSNLSATTINSRSQPLPTALSRSQPLIWRDCCLSELCCMESSHSNTPNASNPQTQTDTPDTQSPTQTQNPTSEGLMVGDRRKAPKSIVWLYCTKLIKKDGNGIEKVIGA
ncbi:unnamed protein product [Prunus armeniaca]